MIPYEVSVLIDQYIAKWRPRLAKGTDAEYLFLSANGGKISKRIGEICAKAFQSYRIKFNLKEKEFSMTKIRKASQTGLEKVISTFRRGSEEAAKALRIFNSGIGHK